MKHKQALSEKHPAVHSDTAKKVSRSINRVRYIVEQVNAHIKTWKILKEDYRQPLNTFPQTITATLMLYTYTTPLNNLP